MDSLGTPYDYQSMMHYNWNAFGRQNGDFGLQTIRTLDRSKQWLLGQRDGFSRTDVIQINKLYQCGKSFFLSPHFFLSNFFSYCLSYTFVFLSGVTNVSFSENLVYLLNRWTVFERILNTPLDLDVVSNRFIFLSVFAKIPLIAGENPYSGSFWIR